MSSQAANAGRTGARQVRTAQESGPPRRALALGGSLGIAVLITAAALAFGPAYGGDRWLIAAAGGALLGALISWGAAALRLHWALSILAAAVAYLVFGAALATPQVAALGVLPTLESVRLLALGVVTSWQQVLTVAVPVGSSGALLVPVYLSSMVLALAGAAVVSRTVRPLFALVAPVAMLVVAALFGTTDPHLPLVSGGAVALGGLLWASLVGTRGRRGHRNVGFDARRPVSGVLVLLATVGAAVFLGPQVAPGVPRLALRTSVNPPFDPQTYPSPLSGFRNFVASDAAKQVRLFTVTGLPDSTHIRLAALDSYDGVNFSVTTDTGTYTRVGDEVAESATGVSVSGRVSIDAYQGVYVPGAGYLTGITFGGSRAARLTDDFRYATSSAVGIETAGLQPGDSFGFQAVVPGQPADTVLASAVVDTGTGLPVPTAIPDAARTAATKYADAVNGAYAKADAMTKGLKAAGHLSHGSAAEALPSASGHGLDRLTKLLTDPQEVGDQEQFAPALSMMLWSQGIPNRVVMGFNTGKHAGGPVTVTGGDVTAWVEVPFLGQGWVAFDPTPDQTSKAPQPTPKQQSAPKPQVVQPPPPPPPPAQAKTSDVTAGKSSDKAPDVPKKNDSPVASAAAGPWWPIGLGVGGFVLLVMAAVGTVLLLKARRRARRRNAATGPLRIAGGWNQVLDAAVDLGFPVTIGRTRVETGADLDRRFGSGTVLLARRADARVFGPEDTGLDDAERFWADVDAALLGLHADQGRWHRFRARLSIASLRRRDLSL